MWLCPAVPGLPATFQQVLTQPLGLFDPDPAANTGLNPPDCQDIRNLREGVQNGMPITAAQRAAAESRIRASGYFTPMNMRDLARRIGWEARVGDYAGVTVDGAEWFGTGAGTTPSSVWPCAPSVAPVACGAGRSLWCSSTDCTTAMPGGAHVRASMNGRLLRAVELLQVTSGAGLQNLVLPYVPLQGTQHRQRTRVENLTTSTDSGWAFGVVGLPIFRFDVIEHDYQDTEAVASSTAPWGSGFPLDAFETATCLPAGIGTPNALWTRAGATLVPLQAFCPAPINNFDHQPVFISVHLSGRPINEEARADAFAWWSGIGTEPVVRGDAAPVIAQLFQTLANGTVVESNTVRTPLRPLGDGADGHQILNYPNQAFWPDNVQAWTSWRGSQVLDAMELACEAGRAFGDTCDLAHPPVVTSIDDLSQVRGYLRCAANAIESRNASMVLNNMPSSVAQVVRDAATRNTATAGGGTFGSQSSQLTAQLLLFRSSSNGLADELRHLDEDIGRLQTSVRLTELRRNRSEAVFVGQITSGVLGCATSLTSGSFTSGLSGCAQSIASISLAQTLNGLEREELDIGSEASFDDFVGSFGDRSSAMRQISAQLDSSYHRVNSLLTEVDTTRREGRGALARAIGADSDAMGRQYAVTTALRRRHSTNVARYQEALLNARRLAYLARRSIEQRFGIDLRELDRDLGLVEPPRDWIDRVCTMTGIDYNRIRSGTTPMTTYADGYIGDYVRRLELLVEGYRLAYRFHDADDTTVLSMRDEILNVRDDCELVADGAEGATGLPRCSVAPRNLLPHGENLAAFGEGAWDYASCTTLGSGMVENCIAVSDLPAGTRGPNVAPIIPFTDGGAPDGTVGAIGTTADEERAFELRFGGPSGVAGTSLAANSRLSQTLTLPVGRYRVSWYGRSPDSTLFPKDVLYVNGTQVSNASVGQWAVTSATAGWARYWYVFDVTSASGSTANAEIGFGHGATLSVKTVQLSSLMLESVDSSVALGTAITSAPGAFMPSGYGTGMVLPFGEDTDGDRFRQRWRRDCVRLCPGGFSSCEISATEPYCFYETQFAVSEESIEQGRIIRPGGFALGNFNYRFNSVALNFVGTGARTCEDDTRPSSCYSSAYIPYSLYHDGPFTVRNHVGGSYYAPVTPGRLEHGRGLAAERYISNPMSSADQSLLSQYTHSEWRGRPLTGRYTVRVWDVEGVNFQGIEDVQVVLGYHYWTRAE